MKFVRMLLWLIVLIALAGGGVAIAARFHDGPLGPFPGGAFKSGEVVSDAGVDWTFATDLQEIELWSDGRSRTTWAIVSDRELYIPCSTKFPPLKNWHERALQNPKAEVRIAGKRYARELRRVEDPGKVSQLLALASKKYPAPPFTSSADDVWVFHLVAPGAPAGAAAPAPAQQPPAQPAAPRPPEVPPTGPPS